MRIDSTKSVYVLNISVALLYFYIDQYFHTHYASDYSYTRPYFRAFYLFDTWSYAILLSSFLFIVAIIERDRLRSFLAVLILILTSTFNVLFLGVNHGYYFPWNLITTEPDHWLMQWGLNLIVSIQWMLLLIGILKNRRFTLILIPLGSTLVVISSLFRNGLQHMVQIGATPIEVAYGITLFVLSGFTTGYLIYREDKQLIPAVVWSLIINVFFGNISVVAWFAPRIHTTIPAFIFERDLCLVSILLAIMASFFSSKIIKKQYFLLDKKYLMATIAIIVILSPLLGHVQHHGRDNVIVEYIGGKYEARIRLVHSATREEFCYIDEGEGHSAYYDVRFRPSLDWINGNTPEDSVFLSWWDYGHMIRGIAERDTIIFAPSEEILWSIVEPGQIHEYSDHQRVLDVAQASTTANAGQASSLMDRYRATHIFVSEDDAAKAGVLLKIIGKDPATYITSGGFTQEGKQMILYKMLQQVSMVGFEMVYNDATVTIYKRI